MRLTARHTMGAAALLMAMSVFLSRIMGLVRDKVISWQFGAGADTDVYFAAFVVPDFINHLLAGGYVAMTLIPLLAGRFEQDADDAWDFFSAVICWATLGATALTLVALALAPELAHFTAPGFDAGQLERLTLYLRIILPGQVFFLTGACFTALLYIRKAFTVPALTPLIYNGCIILGGIVWPMLTPLFMPEAQPDMTGYAVGVTVGAALGACALPLWAVLGGGLRLRLRFRHPLLRRYVWLALPLMLGQSVVVLDEQLVRIFGSMAGQGAVSLLNYARRIMLVPVGVVAQAAGVASFPFLAGLAAKNDRLAFDATLGSALRGSLLVILPVTAWMMAASTPLLGIIFEGGRFGPDQTRLCAPLLQLLLLGVPFWAVQQVVGRAFYAWQDTMTPAVIGTLVTVAVVPLYPWMVARWQAPGVAAMSVLAMIGYALILCGWWGRRFGRAAFAGLMRPMLRGSGMAGVAGLVAWQATLLMAHTLTPSMILNWSGQLWELMGGRAASLAGSLGQALAAMTAHGINLTVSGLCFALVYALCARALLPEALRLPRRKR